MRLAALGAAAAVPLIGLGALLGYQAGIGATGVTSVSATMYVGDHQASGEVDGWWYGVQGSVAEWQGPLGRWHEGGWPSCLDRVSSEQPIKFGWVRASAPRGSRGREVIYIICPPT